MYFFNVWKRINFVQPNSQVEVVEEDPKKIIESWLPDDKKIGENLYRASVHGFGSFKFHERCDYKVKS